LIYLAVYGLLVLLRLAAVGRPVLLRQLYWPAMLALFVFVAFRFEVGCDWSGYLNQYEVQAEGFRPDILDLREPLWWSIIELTHRLGLPYPWLNVFAALIFFSGLTALARRQPDPLAFLVLCFPVLIMNMPMAAIRQAAAIGVLCFAFNAFTDRRTMRFVLLVGVAATLHASAFVFLLLAPFVRGGLSLGRVAAAAALAVPAALVFVGGALAEMVVERYAAGGIAREAEGAVFRLIPVAGTGAFFLLVMRREWALRFPRDLRLAVFGALVMLATMPLLLLSSVAGDRLGYFVMPLQAMIFARMPYLRLGALKPLFVIAPYLGLGMILGYWVFNSWIFRVCYGDYRTWLFGFPRDITYIF
jgi:hypothetical protein